MVHRLLNRNECMLQDLKNLNGFVVVGKTNLSSKQYRTQHQVKAHSWTKHTNPPKTDDFLLNDTQSIYHSQILGM